VAIQVPENAELSVLGDDWKCQRGFRKAGSKCVALVLPENAEIDAIGNDWACKRGYRKAGGKCAAMSEKERTEQDRAVDAAVARRRALSDASCEIDGKPAKGTHAEVIELESGCSDWFLAESHKGVYLIQWYGGYSPSKGDIIIGPIDAYGFKDVCYASHGEGRVYVDDYLLSASRALEKLRDKCD
jgi:hypothetical protein